MYLCGNDGHTTYNHSTFMDGKDYDEKLKLDIANAMSKGDFGINGEYYEEYFFCYYLVLLTGQYR